MNALSIVNTMNVNRPSTNDYEQTPEIPSGITPTTKMVETPSSLNLDSDMSTLK